MAENPPLNRIYVLGYSANDRDHPIVSLNADPRVAGYKVPEDLSTCPDKRYPNHVFTGAQPLSGDERVRHVWEILPSPYVPFTRYDDDLGPVQGRRRSVKNEGQVAVREADKQVTYEAREGSAIVYTELEETWSIKVDEDGNSLFPIRDRDFYDASRGPVQERRQLFVPTGEEEGSLENVNGVITQTSYEPYNEFLSVKIVQTYKVDGPQLIGKATDNDGQLVTVTTQRKGADGYIPPNPTATRTVEVSREDAESLVERIVDTPEIFKANTFSVERPDPIPQKFRVAVPIQSSQEIVEGTAVTPTLEEGEISKSEEQRNKFIKRVSATSRDQAVLPQTLTGKTTNNDRQEVTVTETLQLGNTNESPSATTTIESEALGDGNYVITKTEVDEVFGAETFRKTREDITPQKFKAAQEDSTAEQNIAGTASPNISLATGEFAKSEQQINKFVKRVSTTSRAISEAVVLVERVLTNEGQVGTRTLRLQAGDQTFTPTATMIDASVEALGDGRTVKSETVVPSVFASRSVVKTRVDLTPEKFRAAQQDSTTEENLAGVVNPNIVLGAGEFRKSEQQVTEFIKRISSTTRDISASTDLTEVVITNQGQVATRTLRLSATPQSIQPDALLVDGSIEALGDGRTIKTEVRVGEVFDGKSLSASKPDVIPPAFRASAPAETTQETVAQDSVSMPALGADDLEKTEQRVTDFTVRKTTTSRDNGNLPVLSGQEYEPNVNIVVQYDESVVASGSKLGNPATIVDPLSDDFDLVREFDLDAIEAELNSIMLEFPSRANLTLPPVLKSIEVIFNTSKETGLYQSNGSAVGDGDGAVSASESGSARASSSVIPEFKIEIEEVYSNNIPTTSYIFFLKYPVTLNQILNKLGVQQWPVFKPKSHNIVATGQTKSVSVSASGSYSASEITQPSGSSGGGQRVASSSGSGFGGSTQNTVVVAKIPPCLHSPITINETKTEQGGASVNFSWAGTPVSESRGANATSNGSCVDTLTATSPTDIPRSQRYLIDSRVDLYQYGFARIYAEVIDALIFA